YTQARKIRQKLVKDNPAVTEYQNDLAVMLHNMGALLEEEGKRGEALKVYTQAREILQKLVKSHPAVPKYQKDLALTLINMGSLRRQMQQPKEALALLDESLKHLHAVLKRDPRYSLALDYLWRTYYTRAQTLTDLKRHAEAAADWGKVVLAAPAQYRFFGRFG